MGFNAPIEMAEALEKIRKQRGRGTTKTTLLEEAVRQFIERETNPAGVAALFRQALREDPEIVAEVAEAVHEYEMRPGKRRRTG